MIFFKKNRQMQKNVEEIKDFLMHDCTKNKTELKEIKNNLSKIHVKVKNIVEVVDCNGEKALKIIYDFPQVLLSFDENGSPISNDLFKAINALDLIDMSDKLRLVEAINKNNKKS